MTPPEVFEDIYRLSQILGFKIPLDGFMMVLTEKPIIDIVKLDDRLTRDYNYAGAMDEFIESEFGEDALNIIKRNLL